MSVLEEAGGLFSELAKVWSCSWSLVCFGRCQEVALLLVKVSVVEKEMMRMNVCLVE